MSTREDIKVEFKLPTFLNTKGQWVSSDGSLLFQKKKVQTKNIETPGQTLKRFLAKGIPGLFSKEKPPETFREALISGVQARKQTLHKQLADKEQVGFLAAGAVSAVPGAGKGKELLKKVVEKAKGKVERGFVTSVKEAFPQMKVAGQYIPRSTDKLAIKARNLIQSDIETAERMARVGTDDDAVAVGSELIKHYGDEASKVTDAATKAVLYDKGADVANIMAKNLTEQGRTVQAASILGRLTPEGQLRFAAKEIQRYNEAVEKVQGGILGLRKKIPELTGEQSGYILSEMKAVESLPDGIEKAMRFQKLQEYISDLVPSSLYQKIVTVWKAGLLTGVKTSGLNILANVSHAKLEVLKDIPGSAVDTMASLFTKQRALVSSVKGFGKGFTEGIGKGWRYLRTGFDERNIGIKLDYKRVNFGKGSIAKGLQKYEETVFHIIGAEDQPFYYAAKARSITNQAIAQGKNKGLKGPELKKFINEFIENPPDEAVRYAVLDSEIAVFQNQTSLGKIARAIQKTPGGEIIVPFGRTPSAVAMQVINYSPLGFTKPVARIVKAITSGKFDQRLFSQEAGRAITGTAILAAGVELFKAGRITLDRPTTEREQELWELEGRIPNSIKIGDTWRTVQIAGPAGNLLLVGAHFQNEFSKSGSPTEAMSRAVSGSAKSFTEQTFLRGVNQVVEAINDPARSAEGYFGSLLASTIPTISSDVARATDPLERRSETVLQRLQARIPTLREELQPRVNVLGEEEQRVGNFFEVMADPTRPSKEFTTPLVIELRRLHELGHKVTPTKLGDKKGFEGLSQQQNTDLWKRAGQISRDKLTALIDNEAYQQLEDDEKAKKIDEFVDKSKLIARVEKVLEITENMQGEQLKNKLSELKKGGLLTRPVFLKYMELR